MQSRHQAGLGEAGRAVLLGKAAEERPAHVEANDVITTVDGTPVKDLAGLQAVIGKKKAGDTAEVELIRGTQTLKLKVTLGLRG